MLSEGDRRILMFEGAHRGHSAAKEEAIRVELGMTAPRYYQILGRLLDDPDALAADPLLIGALRRGREHSRAAAS
jgi:hypothetical protein